MNLHTPWALQGRNASAQESGGFWGLPKAYARVQVGKCVDCMCLDQCSTTTKARSSRSPLHHHGFSPAMRFIALSVLPERCLSWGVRCGKDQSCSGFWSCNTISKASSFQITQKTTSGDPLLLLQHPFPQQGNFNLVLLWGDKGGREGVATRDKTGLIQHGRVFCLPVSRLSREECAPSPSPLYLYSELICCSGSCTAASRAGKHICILM